MLGNWHKNTARCSLAFTTNLDRQIHRELMKVRLRIDRQIHKGERKKREKQ
jgi:hypothetical protein